MHALKSDHEEWVRSKLSEFDPKKQAEDERWAGYIDEWKSRCSLDDWLMETSFLFAPAPEMHVQFYEQLDNLREWLLSRVWPRNGTPIRHSLQNFAVVLSDLLNQFRKHEERERRDTSMYTREFYRTSEWNEALYRRLLNQFNFHVDLIHDLTLELTRAANHVCQQVREHLDGSFRIKEGVLLVSRQGGMNWYKIRAEYSEQEVSTRPYPGLEKFMTLRSSRNYFVGRGLPPE